MKEEASPREAAHLRREGGGRSQEMQYIHFELLKEQVKSRFSYVPVTNVPFRIRFPHCTGSAYMYLQLSNMLAVSLNQVSQEFAPSKAHTKAVYGAIPCF